MLVEDTEREMVSRMSKARAGTSSSGQRFKIFNDKVLLGDIRGAVKYLSNSETGGVLLPDDLDDMGRSVRSILLEKHPMPRIPMEDHFPVYQEMPEFVDLDITEDTVIEVAKNLSGSGGAGGTDSYTAQSWLLRFGEASCRLRVALANFTCWLANDFPPWASYRGLAVGRLLALDKCPGVRPIGIGETWRRAMAKCVLRVAGKEA